ncbi:MAG: ParB/RepB/Spo0J family partition protein [Treponema sp.]|nr:ParB/RepB/Spo0J family partition protein [Treponema sp.]MBR4005139.1 ParB/RepB/Spo0J family partition protein [Treponema sp.]
MAKSTGLGRGLDALMSDAKVEGISAISSPARATEKPASNLPKGLSQDENGTLWVNPNLLKPNPHQPRRYFDEEKLSELTESVRREGVVQAPVIEDAGDGSFYIIAGERRVRAARAAGLEKIPVQLRKYSDSRKLEVALIENIQRTDLNPIEEAIAYSQLMEMEGITQEDLAARVGKSRSAVANSLRLLKLSEEMQNAIADGSVSPGHARALLSVINPADQTVLFNRIMKNGLSVREAEKQAQELNNGSRAGKTTKIEAPSVAVEKRDPDYVAIENKFRDAFGTKVQMKGDYDKGTITVHYFTKDDLDRIYQIIVKS